MYVWSHPLPQHACVHAYLLYTCMYAHLYVCFYVRTYVRRHARVYVRTYVMYLFLNLHHNVLHMCVFCIYVDEQFTCCVVVDMYMYAYTCMDICTSVRMCVCVLYMYVCMQV